MKILEHCCHDIWFDEKLYMLGVVVVIVWTFQTKFQRFFQPPPPPNPQQAMGAESSSAVEVSESLLHDAQKTTTIHYSEDSVPEWKDQITIRGLVVSALLGSLFCIITHKLGLTVVIVPSLNIAAALLGFFLVKSWTGFLSKLGFSIKPFTRQENTVIQTCVVACYGLAASGTYKLYSFPISCIRICVYFV